MNRDDKMEIKIEAGDVKEEIVPCREMIAGYPEGFDEDKEAIEFLENKAEDMRKIGLEVEEKDEEIIITGEVENFREYLKKELDYQHENRQAFGPADWSSIDEWTDILQMKMENAGIIDDFENL